MTPGTRVQWTSRFGAKLEGTVLEFNPRRPLRKAGSAWAPGPAGSTGPWSWYHSPTPTGDTAFSG